MSLSILGTLERTGDSATVRFDRHYATTAADLWEAVTDAGRLERWFARVTGDLREGGEFVIHFDDDDTPTCRVESCSPGERFTWRWLVAGGRGSVVEVSVTPDGEGARLGLVHSLLDPAKAPEYGAGWDVYVRSLESYVDGTERGDWWDQWAQLKELYS